MTSGQALAQALSKLQDAFPRQPFGERAVRVYAECLADLDGIEVLGAVERLLRVHDRHPVISEIRMEVAEGTDPLPTVEEAWDMAVAGYAPVPTVRETVEAMGGFWAIRHSENPTTLRSQFRRDYEARRAREMRARAGGAIVRAAQLKSAPKKQLESPLSVSLNERRLRQLPESSRVMPRPVMSLLAKRLAGHPPELSPTAEEMHDAILLLKEGPNGSTIDDPLYREAEDVFRRASEIQGIDADRPLR